MNKKEKIIDLLCLINNEEKMPQNIIYKGFLCSWDNDEKDYYCEEYGNLFEYLFSEYKTDEVLNMEVTRMADLPIFEKPKVFNHDADNFTGVKTYINGKEVFSLASEIEEDKDIPLIPDDELIILKQSKTVDMQYAIDFNFRVVEEKINQVVKEFNEYRKENE